ncbi:MAG: DUF4831 family protein [Lentimicrobiaceae bacterium]|nr:DUF4831 family protein [Lentimicrobiaceae bacterium]
MKRFYLLLFGGFLCGLSAVFAQEINEIGQSDAFYYALPENYFEVKVRVQKETFYKGPLADYAGEVTGLASTVKENKVLYKITGITIKEYARADKNQLYKLKKNGNRLRFSYLRNGLLNMERKTFPNHSSEKEKTYAFNTEKTEEINRFSIYSANAVMEKYDTVYTYQEIDSVLVQVQNVTKSLVIKPTKRQAEDAMETLDKIRDARWLLISGEHEVDFSKLEAMLAELQKMENDYLALFSGMVETTEEEHTFIVCPTQKTDIFSLPLFRFSSTEGITEKEIGTVSYSLNFKSLDSQNELIEKTMADSEKQKRKIDADGKTIYYRLPQVYVVTLLENGKPSYVFGEYPIAQLGEVLSLPKKVKRFQLDAFTGGLRFVK